MKRSNICHPILPQPPSLPIQEKSLQFFWLSPTSLSMPIILQQIQFTYTTPYHPLPRPNLLIFKLLFLVPSSSYLCNFKIFTGPKLHFLPCASKTTILGPFKEGYSSYIRHRYVISIQQPPINYTCATQVFDLYLAYNFLHTVFLLCTGILIPLPLVKSSMVSSLYSNYLPASSFYLLLGIYPFPFPNKFFLDPIKSVFKFGLATFQGKTEFLLHETFHWTTRLVQPFLEYFPHFLFSSAK